MFYFICPFCSTKYSLEQDLENTIIQCQQCGNSFNYRDYITQPTPQQPAQQQMGIPPQQPVNNMNQPMGMPPQQGMQQPPMNNMQQPMGMPPQQAMNNMQQPIGMPQGGAQPINNMQQPMGVPPQQGMQQPPMNNIQQPMGMPQGGAQPINPAIQQQGTPARNNKAKKMNVKKKKFSTSPPPKSTPKKAKKKKSSGGGLLYIIIVIAITAGAGFFILKNKQSSSEASNKANNQDAKTDISFDTPADTVVKRSTPPKRIVKKLTSFCRADDFKYTKDDLEKSLKYQFQFENSLESSDKKATLSTYGSLKTAYVKGVTGNGIRLANRELCSMTLPKDPFTAESGTIMFWIKLGETFKSMWGQNVLWSKVGKERGLLLEWSQHYYRWQSNLCTVRGNEAKTTYYSPNKYNWQHIAITWDKKNNFHKLYVNGVLNAYQSSVPYPKDGEIFNPTECEFNVGWGDPERNFSLDDLRVYTRALMTSEIQGIVKDVAPVIVNLENIDESKLALLVDPKAKKEKFTTDVKLNFTDSFDGDLKLDVLNDDGKVISTRTQKVKLDKKQPKAELTWFVPYSPKNTVNRVRATLAGTKNTPAWSATISVIPKDNRLKASRLSDYVLGKKIVSINCTRKTNDDNYYSNFQTVVVNKKAGTYRETNNNDFSFFSYKFEIKNPENPHILAISYPNDKKRIFAVDINDGSKRPPQGSGVQTGLFTPLDNKMKVMYIPFWPTTKNCLVTACNWGKAPNNFGSIIPAYGTTAALARIEVYEVKDNILPNLKLKNNIKNSRNVGVWVEDSSLAGFWGSKEGYEYSLKGWNKVCENLVQYLQYMGITEYQYPVVWYDGNLFRTPTLDAFNQPTDRTAAHPKGCFATLLKIFEKYGIKMYPIFYFRDLGALNSQLDRKSTLDVTKNHISDSLWKYRYRTDNPGGDDMLQYYKNGATKNSPYGGNDGISGSTGPVFNPLHPNVNSLFLNVTRDWLDLYGNFPALGGIMLDLGVSWGGAPQADSLSFNRLESGYGDFTVNLFQKETGIKLPKDMNDTDDNGRFMKRYKFLTSPEMKDKWIAWRCKKIDDCIVSPLREELNSYSPDLKLQIAVAPSPGLGPKILGKTLSLSEALKQSGVDIKLYEKLNNTELIRHGISSQNVTKCYPIDNLSDSWPLNTNQDTGVSAITSSYWEMFSHGKILDPVRKKWPEVGANQLPTRIIIDAGAGILAHAAYAIMKKDISCLYLGGMGFLPTLGHEKPARRFFSAFRALPKTHFDDISGLEDPIRGRQKVVDGSNYFYLVNAEPYPIGVTLKLNSDGLIKSLATGKNVKTSSRTLKIVVKPYMLLSFKTDSKLKVVSGKTSIPSKEYKKLYSKYLKLKANYLGPMSEIMFEKKNKEYIWIEAENWKKWETNEKFNVNHAPFSLKPKTLISGGNFISFGGDRIPVQYDLNISKNDKYDAWVRFVTKERNPNLSKWVLTINGQKVSEIKTTEDPNKLWVKFPATLTLDKGSFTLGFKHDFASYSVAVDSFLITNDHNYKPKGACSPTKFFASKMKFIKQVDDALKRKNMAKLRVYLTVLESLTK